MQPENLTGNQRGRMGERLVECYINDELIPSLKKTEGWTDIIYTIAWCKATYPQCYINDELARRTYPQKDINDELARRTYPQKEIQDFIKFVEEKQTRLLLENYQDFIKFVEEKQTRLLLANGFYPTKEFICYFNKLVDSLSNRPDGFLIKMKRMGRYGKIKEAIEEYTLTSKFQLEDLNRLLELPNEDKILPVVDGKIEVVEVKTGVGNLQVDSYRNAVANGYPLRLFKVDLKVPLIWEKVIVNPNEVVSNFFKEMNTFAKRWNI
jgi:hypothetical protein